MVGHLLQANVAETRQEVLADSQPIKLGGRTLDVLMAPFEARGAVVSTGALMARFSPSEGGQPSRGTRR
jgi:DNA-binding winged helix-turn-helix (wHTH) protein